MAQIDEGALLRIMERMEELESRCESSELVGSDAVKTSLRDIQRLVDALLDERNRVGKLRKRWGSVIYRQSEAIKAALNRQRRNRCGLDAKQLFLLRSLIEDYPRMPIYECGNRATGRDDMTLAGVRDMLSRAGWGVRVLRFRYLFPHGKGDLPAIPIADSWAQAVAEEGDYEAKFPMIPPEDESEGEPEEEESEGVGDGLRN